MLASVVARLPVCVAELIYANAAAGGGMDELASSKVYSAVGSARLIGGEKYEISRDKL